MPNAPAQPAAPKQPLTLETIGSAYKAKYNNPTLGKISDWMMGAKVVSDTQKSNPQAPGLTMLGPDQMKRIPSNIDDHLKMLAQAFSDQANPPAKPPLMTDSQATSKILDYEFGNIPGVSSALTGATKQVLGLPWDAAQLGAKIGNELAKIPGLGYLKSDAPQTPQALQPEGMGEQIGNLGAQVGEFFIPGGAEEKATKALDDALTGVNIAEKIGLSGKSADLLNTALRVVGKGLITSGSMGAVTAVQTGGDKNQTIGSAELGFGAGALGKIVETISPGIAKAFQKADFKLSPQQEAKAAEKAEAAAQFMTNNKILGSETTKYTKLDALNGQLEETLQKSVPDLNVKKSDIISSIDSNVESLRTKDPAVYSAARTDANEAIKTLQGDGKPSITTEQTLAGKRSWGSRAFNTTKYATKDPRVTSEGAYAVELAYQKAFSDSLDRVGGTISIPPELQSYFGGQSEVDLKSFNKVYSDAITSKNLTFMAQSKKDSGLMGRLFGLWAGETLGQTISPGLGGKIIGGAAGEMASTHLPGVVRNVGERLANHPNIVPNTAKGFRGLLNKNTNQ